MLSVTHSWWEADLGCQGCAGCLSGGYLPPSFQAAGDREGGVWPCPRCLVFWHRCIFLIAFHGCWVEFIVFLDHAPPGEMTGEEPGNQLPGMAWWATGGFLGCHWEEGGRAGVQR